MWDVTGRISRVTPLLAGVSVALSGCGRDGLTLMFPYGVVAANQREWFLFVIAMVAIVVLPLFVLLPLFVWRYRRSNASAAYRPDWGFSWPLEIAIWGIPCCIVAVLAGLIVTRETRFDPYNPLPSTQTPLPIQVIALNWKWLFIYPEQHIAATGQLVLPVGRPVRFYLTSDATMQSFFIPALGSQIYAMVGMVTQLNLRADKPGTLLGENTQFNGTGFSGDRFAATLLPPDAFAAWVAKTGRDGPTLDAGTYATLSDAHSVTTNGADFHLERAGIQLFANVQPGLFESIVAKYRPAFARQMSMPK